MGRARLYFSVGPLCCTRSVKGEGSVKKNVERSGSGGKARGKM